MKSKYIHPAAWEAEWIELNKHRYGGDMHCHRVQKAIVTRTSFTTGRLFDDKDSFHKGDAQRGIVGKGMPVHTVVKAMRVTDLTNRWSKGSTAVLSLILNSPDISFEELRDHYKPYHDLNLQTAEELFSHGFLSKDNKLESASYHMLSREVGLKTVFFTATNPIDRTKHITMVADIHGFAYTYKVEFQI